MKSQYINNIRKHGFRDIPALMGTCRILKVCGNGIDMRMFEWPLQTLLSEGCEVFLRCQGMDPPVHGTSIYSMMRTARYSVLLMPSAWQGSSMYHFKGDWYHPARSLNPWPTTHKASTLTMSHWCGNYNHEVTRKINTLRRMIRLRNDTYVKNNHTQKHNVFCNKDKIK